MQDCKEILAGCARKSVAATQGRGPWTNGRRRCSSAQLLIGMQESAHRFQTHQRPAARHQGHLDQQRSRLDRPGVASVRLLKKTLRYCYTLRHRSRSSCSKLLRYLLHATGSDDRPQSARTAWRKRMIGQRATRSKRVAAVSTSSEPVEENPFVVGLGGHLDRAWSEIRQCRDWK